MKEWFKKEEFWKILYPYMFSESRFASAGEEVEKIVALSGFKGRRVLDLCCGPGRHSCAFAEKGYEVTGVDLSPFLMSKAKSRAEDLNLKIEWILKDMRDFVKLNAFDLTVNLFTSFGYFDDKNDDLKVLINIYKSLRSGGLCVLDMLGKEILAKIFQLTTSKKMDDGAVFIERHEIFDNWSRIRNEWIIIKDKKNYSFKFHHTMYSGQELKEKLLEAGFCEVKLFGSFEGKEYDTNASRLIAVARKR